VRSTAAGEGGPGLSLKTLSEEKREVGFWFCGGCGMLDEAHPPTVLATEEFVPINSRLT